MTRNGKQRSAQKMGQCKEQESAEKAEVINKVKGREKTENVLTRATVCE